MRSLLIPVIVTLVGLVAAPSTAVAGPAAPAGGKIVVHGKFKRLSKDKQTITYSASNGTYSATWIGVRHYRLRGKIEGRRFTGSIRTHQASNHNRYVARGSGKLGSRKVKITGGGSNNLKTATLVLS